MELGPEAAPRSDEANTTRTGDLDAIAPYDLESIAIPGGFF